MQRLLHRTQMRRDDQQKMRNDSRGYDFAAVSTLTTGSALAAPIEGEMGSNAAALLLLLGVGALLMGARNLRELRHKRLALNRETGESDTPDTTEPDSGNCR